MSVRWAWKICGWCTRQGFRVSLWTTWLVLLAVLAGQIYLLSARRIPIPGLVRRVIAERLATKGLRADFGQGMMNFTGRVILEDVRFGSTDSPEPLATARSVYLNVDAWDLILGKIDVNEIRVSGLDFHLPPINSASGGDELPASNIDFSVRPRGKEIELSYLTGYVGPLTVQASGHFRPPADETPGDSHKVVLDRVIAAYLKLAIQTQANEVWLNAFESPRLQLRFNPVGMAVDFRANAIDLGKLPGGTTGKLAGVRLKTRLPFRGFLASPMEIAGTADSLDLPHEIKVRDLSLRLHGIPGGPAGFEPRSLELQLGSLDWRKIGAGPLTATATQGASGSVNADLSLNFAGAPWRLYGAVSPKTGTAQVSLEGFVGDTTLAFAGAQIGRDLTALLDPAHPAPLHARASFGPGWKLAEASGRLHSGPVRVGGAQLDETGTDFSYDGDRVLCDSLVLRQGKSLAHGSYEMNTHTMDFRFLLTGGLEPAGIKSWFHEWWSNFWVTFDFSRGLPAADVDVRGRWGDLTATRVFVQAEGGETGLKGVPFDRVRTRLFLRPHWFDILHFDVLQNGQEANGRLVRSLDLAKDTWRHMEFSVDSTLPLETISTLFKEESAELLAPYHFTAPPRLQLTGRVDSAASPLGKKEHIDIDLISTGPMTYHGFPLSDLKFSANLRDDRIDLPRLAVGFAKGQAVGTARLWGAEDARRLAFDITLADANLGAVTQAIALLEPPPPTAKPPTAKAIEAARLRQERLDKGNLVFSLAAEGLYKDFYSFNGSGRAAITGAELAQLNLFGPLSEALRGTYFNFSSFSLTTVDAPFVLAGEQVDFEHLRVTGPSALLQAKGSYHLRGGHLDFTTKIHPFEESESVVGTAVSFVLTPLSKVFEVKLTGTLSNPSWIFSYGPSRLINSITGGDKNAGGEPKTAELP